LEVEALIGEVNGDSAVDEFSEVGPIPKVAGTAIYFMDQNTLGSSLPEKPEHLGESRATSLGSSLALFEPLGDFKVVAFRILLYS
jgi:hypothetical protein